MAQIDVVSSRDGESTTVVPNHRHCQSTVCSAAGHQDGGSTWAYINNQNNFTNLPSDWKEKFAANISSQGQNSITFDFVAILQILNQVAGDIKSSQFTPFNVEFQDNHGNHLDQFTADNNGGTKRVILGKDIELKIGGKSMWKFNTMGGISDAEDEDEEALDVGIGDLPISYNSCGEVSCDLSTAVYEDNTTNDSVTKYYRNEDVFIGRKRDDGTFPHIYRMEANGKTVSGNTEVKGEFTFFAIIHKDNYPTTDMVHWEFHLKNTSDSDYLPVSNTFLIGFRQEADQQLSTIGTTHFIGPKTGATKILVNPGETMVFEFWANIQTQTTIAMIARTDDPEYGAVGRMNTNLFGMQWMRHESEDEVFNVDGSAYVYRVSIPDPDDDTTPYLVYTPKFYVSDKFKGKGLLEWELWITNTAVKKYVLIQTPDVRYSSYPSGRDAVARGSYTYPNWAQKINILVVAPGKTQCYKFRADLATHGGFQYIWYYERTFVYGVDGWMGTFQEDDNIHNHCSTKASTLPEMYLNRDDYITGYSFHPCDLSDQIFSDNEVRQADGRRGTLEDIDNEIFLLNQLHRDYYKDISDQTGVFRINRKYGRMSVNPLARKFHNDLWDDDNHALGKNGELWFTPRVVLSEYVWQYGWYDGYGGHLEFEMHIRNGRDADLFVGDLDIYFPKFTDGTNKPHGLFSSETNSLMKVFLNGDGTFHSKPYFIIPPHLEATFKCRLFPYRNCVTLQYLYAIPSDIGAAGATRDWNSPLASPPGQVTLGFTNATLEDYNGRWYVPKHNYDINTGTRINDSIYSYAWYWNAPSEN